MPVVDVAMDWSDSEDSIATQSGDESAPFSHEELVQQITARRAEDGDTLRGIWGFDDMEQLRRALTNTYAPEATQEMFIDLLLAIFAPLNEEVVSNHYYGRAFAFEGITLRPRRGVLRRPTPRCPTLMFYASEGSSVVDVANLSYGETHGVVMTVPSGMSALISDTIKGLSISPMYDFGALCVALVYNLVRSEELVNIAITGQMRSEHRHNLRDVAC
jgi:hypothetical protein